QRVITRVLVIHEKDAAEWLGGLLGGASVGPLIASVLERFPPPDVPDYAWWRIFVALDEIVRRAAPKDLLVAVSLMKAVEDSALAPSARAIALRLLAGTFDL